jgi:hypothetical protein
MPSNLEGLDFLTDGAGAEVRADGSRTRTRPVPAIFFAVARMCGRQGWRLPRLITRKVVPEKNSKGRWGERDYSGDSHEYTTSTYSSRDTTSVSVGLEMST